MTHARQGKDHQPEHSMACTAAPGPCICYGPKVEHLTIPILDIGKILVQDPIVNNHLTVRNKRGVDVAVFDADHNLTGGHLHKEIAGLESRVALRDHQIASFRHWAGRDRRTIIMLTVLSIAGWGYGLARGIWGF